MILTFHKETDQRLSDAFRWFEERVQTVTIGNLVCALQRLNARGLDIVPFDYFDGRKMSPVPNNRINEVTGAVWQLIWEVERKVEGETLSSAAFIKEAFSLMANWESFGTNSFTNRLLDCCGFPRPPYSPKLKEEEYLHSVAKAKERAKSIMRRVSKLSGEPDDYQYFLTLCNGKVSFRISSALGDYSIGDNEGVRKEFRALLTHFGKIGYFTTSCIEELEELLNSNRVKEKDYQNFFEKYPHFLRKWDHREVWPHIVLENDTGGLIPDFILTNGDTQDHAILELKSPKKRIIRRQLNRIRFSDAIMEARAQLLTYQRWFDLPENRRLLSERIGAEVFQPRLITIIGRSSEFITPLERQQLKSTLQDVCIATYDDILQYAKHRKTLIELDRK